MAVVTNTVLNTISDDSKYPCAITDGIKQIEKSNATLFPNPSTGVFTLVNNQEIPNSISVYDKTGRVLLNVMPTSNSTSLDLSNYAANIYFIQVSYSDRVEAIKALIID